MLGEGSSLADPRDLDATLASEQFFQDPHPTWRRLRENAPVFWSETWGGWIVTRHEDVSLLHRDLRLGNYGLSLRYLDAVPSSDSPEFAAFRAHYSIPSVNDNDPPGHTPLRALALKALGPAKVASIRGYAEERAGNLAKAFAGRGEADIVSEFAALYSPAVIGHVLGLPEDEVAFFKALTHRGSEFFGRPAGDVAVLRSSQEATEELELWLLELLKSRRAHPHDDLVTFLTTVNVDGIRLTDAQLMAIIVDLMTAGDETTANLIPTGIWLLSGLTGGLDTMLTDETRMRSAIDEILRYEPPFPVNERLVREDLVVGGNRIREGDVVWLSIAAANRDPSVFETPDELQLDRTPNRHITFGVGPHFCAGHTLARMELTVAFRVLLETLGDFRVNTAEPRWYPHLAHRGLESLRVSFTPS